MVKISVRRYGTAVFQYKNKTEEYFFSLIVYGYHKHVCKFSLYINTEMNLFNYWVQKAFKSHHFWKQAGIRRTVALFLYTVQSLLRSSIDRLVVGHGKSDSNRFYINLFFIFVWPGLLASLLFVTM